MSLVHAEGRYKYLGQDMFSSSFLGLRARKVLQDGALLLGPIAVLGPNVC